MNPGVDIGYYGYCGQFGLSEAMRTNSLACKWAGYSTWNEACNEALLNSDGQRLTQELEAPVTIHHWHPSGVHLDAAERFFQTSNPYRIAYWAWEVEGAIHPAMQTYADYFDEIWTPSEYCKYLLEPLGVPVFAIPHAVRWGPKPNVPRAQFTVLCPLDAWSRLERKNPEAAVEAFLRGIPLDATNARLILKVSNLSKDGADRAAINDLVNRDPRIQLSEGFLTEPQMVAMVARADCLLSLHRSEGYGLNVARAAATGVPVVATDYGGCAEWMPDAYRVPWTPTEVNDNDYYPVGSVWAEPCIDVAADMLQTIYGAPETAHAEAEAWAQVHAARLFSLDRLSWDIRHRLQASKIF